MLENRPALLRHIGAPHLAIALGVALLTGLAPALACLWDTDTVRDELEANSSTFEVITGQVPEHSMAYYEARLQQTLDELSRAPEDIELMYDAGAAYVRLGRYEAAAQAFDKAEAIAADRYKTHSNRGVLYHRMGRLDDAIRHMRRAVELRPDAHFDSGYLHLKMLEWEKRHPDGARPQTDFLGQSYGEAYGLSIGYMAKKSAEERGIPWDESRDAMQELERLIRANPEFADAYFVLGDNLRNSSRLNLALWAYVRAIDLGHPRPDVVTKRIDLILDHWKDVLRHGIAAGKVQTRDEVVTGIRQQLPRAEVWRRKFIEIDGDLVKQGTLPSFDATFAVLRALGIERMAPGQWGWLPQGVTAGSPAKLSPSDGPQTDANQAHPSRSGPANGEARGAEHKEQEQQGPPPVGKADAQDGDAPRPQRRARDNETPPLTGG